MERSKLIIKRKPMSKKFLMILGVAHSDNVAGKQSPDGRHHEPLWSKAQCALLKLALDDLFIPCVVIQPKADDLAGRVAFVRECEAARKGYEHCLVFPLHNNAAGMGLKWMNATGWCVFTSRGITASDPFGNKLWYMLKEEFPELYARYYKVTDNERDYEENFTTLMGNYTAVLLEWLFQDNKDDLAKIENADICKRLRKVIISWITEINKNYNSI